MTKKQRGPNRLNDRSKYKVVKKKNGVIAVDPAPISPER